MHLKMLTYLKSKAQGKPEPNAGALQPGAAASDPLSSAKAAIAKGAPRDAVIQRFKQHGINPEGL